MSGVGGVSAERVREIVAAVLAELDTAGSASALPPPPPPAAPPPGAPPAPPPPAAPAAPSARAVVPTGAPPVIDVPDPTLPERRRAVGVTAPANPSGLANLVASTGARIGVGRAGPRPRTATRLLFLADHAVTQDAIFGDVPQDLLDQLGLFTVQTQVATADEYLLRPDLGRRLDDVARATIAQRCVPRPQVQIVVGDGLSAAAVAHNLSKIYPVLSDGLAAAGISVGTPFFVRYCRVGVMNAVNEIVQADVVVLLIGERPGLGVADALSIYSGWRPGPGRTDADRDVICMITENGGTNPLEAGAFAVEHVRTVLSHQASGVELRLALGSERAEGGGG